VDGVDDGLKGRFVCVDAYQLERSYVTDSVWIHVWVMLVFRSLTKLWISAKREEPMKPSTGWKWLLATSAIVLIISATPASATPIVQYTFESPVFSINQTTPILNASPNIDPTGGAFKTSFTDATTPGATNFVITTFPANGLIQGQNLFEPLGVPIDPLALTFNMPIDQLIVSFGLNDVVVGGALQLVTSTAVTITQLSSAQAGGAGFPGGTLSFSTLTPFTSATLRAFTASGSATQFAIDNLQLDVAQATSTVPEPATITLIGLGLAAGLRHRRRQPRS
jgi:hypothetical protein